MDPKQQEMLKHIDAMLQAANMLALARYAQLLHKLGVRQPKVYNLLVLP